MSTNAVEVPLWDEMGYIEYEGQTFPFMGATLICQVNVIYVQFLVLPAFLPRVTRPVEVLLHAKDETICIGQAIPDKDVVFVLIDGWPYQGFLDFIGA